MAGNSWIFDEKIHSVVHRLDKCSVCHSFSQHCSNAVDTSFMEARHEIENAIQNPLLSTIVVLQKDIKEAEKEAIALKKELKEIETELKKVRQEEDNLLNLVLSHSCRQPERS